MFVPFNSVIYSNWTRIHLNFGEVYLNPSDWFIPTEVISSTLRTPPIKTKTSVAQALLVVATPTQSGLAKCDSQSHEQAKTNGRAALAHYPRPQCNM